MRHAHEAPVRPGFASPVSSIDTSAEYSRRWGPRSHRIAATTAAGFLMAVAAVLWALTPGTSRVTAVVVLTSLAAGLILVAAVVRGWPGLLAASAALGVAPGLAMAVTAAWAPTTRGWVPIGYLVLIVAGAVLAGCAPTPWVRTTAALVIGVAGVGVGLSYTSFPPARVSAVVIVVVVTGLGLLPWRALTVTGTHRVVNTAGVGEHSRAASRRFSLDDAYDTTTWMLAALGGMLILSMPALAHEGGPWAAALAAFSVIAAALRIRPFPLTIQIAVGWTAALVATIVFLVERGGDLLVSLGVLAAVASVIVVSATLAPERQAGWHRVGDTVDLWAAAATIPCLLGVFGVFSTVFGAA